MRVLRTGIALLMCSAPLWGCGGSIPSSPPPPRAVTFRELLQMQRPAAVEIAPDGRRIAFVTRSADLESDVMRTTLWSVDATGGGPRRLSPAQTNIGTFRWSPAGDLLAFVAVDSAGSRIDLVTASGTVVRTITGEGIADFAWAPDGTQLAYTAPDSDPELPQLWRIDLGTGVIRRVVEERAAVTDPQWSADGRSIAYVRFPADLPDAQFFPTIQVVDVDSGSSRTVAGPDEFVSSPRWSPDGTRLAYLSHPAHDEPQRALAFNHIAVLPVAGGVPWILAPSFPYEPRRPAWSGDGQTLFFEAFTGETGQLFSVPPAGGDPVAFTAVDGIAYTASYARDGSAMALLIEAPSRPPEVFFSPLTQFAPHQLTDLNRALREAPAGESRIVRWTSSDGLGVSGVLLLPPGFREGASVPTLVVSHGGPATFVALQYPDAWLLAGAAAWISDGWAVFFPNYRGSTNHDEAFALAEIGEFGRGDFADVMTGVETLVAQGIADPDRLAHAGWSFGGYLGGWACTHTSRFKAIVAGAGPYDWTTTYRDGEDQFVLRSYLEGTPATNPQRYQEASVSTWVGNARTPTLLFGAGADVLVPPAEPQAFFDALQARDVPSALRIFPNEPHELQRPSNQLEKLEREREWIRRYTESAAATSRVR